MIKSFNKYAFAASLLAVILFLSPGFMHAQYTFKNMSVGSLHNFYSAIGAEIEEGRTPKSEQDGFQWPAIYKNQDMQCATAVWIGTKDFKDATGNYPYRVVHVGPRVPGTGEFFPVELKMYSKFEQPAVTVDNNPSFEKTVEIDEVNPDLPYDRLIVNKVNTLLGITMERKIFQFSNPYHDNYIVMEYTFTNTGYTSEKNVKVLDQTLKDVYFYFNYRWAINKQSRYVIGNQTGWGMNTMIDTRGDGVLPDPAGEKFRTQFAWHGYCPTKQVTYNNIGGPIWDASKSEGYAPPSDTIGRLAATQFMGVLTLHADYSATDNSDNQKLPITTYENSDAGVYSGNSAFDIGKMQDEYLNYITRPTANPRHGCSVHPAAMAGGTLNFMEFANQTGDPAKGTSGGFSANNSYGPYTLAPGQSVKIIMVEGASGISREAAVEMGRKYKDAEKTPNFAAVEKEKNELVLTGKDSLMQTWKRVTENYNNNWNMVQAPKPPKMFSITSAGDQIALKWDSDDPSVKGFEIYRALGQYDSTYHLLYTAGPDERSYADKTPVRGLYYFYYIVSVGDDQPANPTLNIPAYTLKSSRYYTQTYDGANLLRPAGTNMNRIRIVPNPFFIGADANKFRFGDQYQNELHFYNIPGKCTIKIFTELGELIKTIEHTNGSGDEYWRSVTSSNQMLVSGIYIAVVTNNETGEKHIAKFSVIR
ncbi:MAG: hypothetical protein HF314_14815 [Ignavibacteria bacterium]|jgi:hypothetical protein|nr:hypothetical protein [Ignavibacteria bacterium]MCU7504351.1 hypothetical protein [Ignavibacteria bacterium]MCU7517574.1 hypothetical protein [Ignavibacteria bacterium]